MSDNALVKQVDDILAASQFGVIQLQDKHELTKPEAVALAREINEIKAVDKVIKERVEDAKRVFFESADKVAGKEKPYVIYAPEYGVKMVRSISGGEPYLDGDALKQALFDSFGEKLEDTSGKAYALWTKVTDPVQTRVLNRGKLDAELKQTLEHEQGKKHGSKTTYLPREVVEQATKTSSVTERFLVPVMTKQELKDAQAGTLEEADGN